MKIIYLDVETTGFDEKTCGLLQVAGIISANGKSEEFDLIMNPGDVVYDRDSAIINENLTMKQIKEAPPSIDVFNQFIQLLSKYVNRYNSKDKFHVVAYNGNFDMQFLRAWFLKHNDQYFGSWFWHPVLDVMYLAAFHLLGKRHLMDNFKLSTVYEFLFEEDFPNAHYGLDDVRATKRILNYILTKQGGL